MKTMNYLNQKQWETANKIRDILLELPENDRGAFLGIVNNYAKQFWDNDFAIWDSLNSIYYYGENRNWEKQ